MNLFRSQTVWVLAASIVLLLLWQLHVAARPASALVAESNQIAGLGKLQKIREGTTHALVGTSIIAKLNAAQALNSAPIALNLGLDGASGLLALEHLAALEQPPQLVVLEANLLTRLAPGNTASLRETASSWWFRTSAKLSALQISNRPSTVIYSWLKALKDGTHSTTESSDTVPLANATAASRSPSLTAQEADIYAIWHSILAPIRERGTRVVLVTIPDNGASTDTDARLAHALSAELTLLHIDLRTVLDHEDLRYSDGTHLTVPSAARVSHVLHRSLSAAGLL